MFDEVLFPEEFGEAVGGPTFETLTSKEPGGGEGRVLLWERGRQRWAVTFDALSQEQAATLTTFFLARRGRLRGFRFRDPLDDVAFQEPLAHGGLATVQLTKTYTNGNASYVRKITKPVTGTITLSLNSLAVAPEDFTLDDTLGTITLATPPAPEDILEWSGRFHVPVRFDNDSLLSRVDALEQDAIEATGIFDVDSVILMELV